MKLIPESLASRLTLWNAAVILVFFGVAFPVLFLLVDLALVGDMDADLAEDIESFRGLRESAGLQRVEEEIMREMATDVPGKVFFRIVGATDQTLFSVGLSDWGETAPGIEVTNTIATANEPVLKTVFRGTDGVEFRVVSGRIGPDRVLQIGETMEDHRALMDLLLELFASIYLLIVPFSALLGWLMARHGLRGIDAVRCAAEDIADGNLERRVRVSDPGSEIERLALSFNTMADRVNALISGMREMTDNIAHDMKSPLARIRANLELALTHATTVDAFRASAADTLEDCERMAQMIDATLTLAEAEARADRRGRDRVRLGEVAADACDLFEPVAEDKAIRLSLNIDTDCIVEGHLQQLQRMLANLIDNGIKYTDGSGEVEIRVGTADGGARVSVRDTGIGIPEEDLERIFHRFYRGERSRSGSGFGLGLCFCRAVARAHGGDIQVASVPGQGSVFTATLNPALCDRADPPLLTS